jgi:hypothetical protein
LAAEKEEPEITTYSPPIDFKLGTTASQGKGLAPFFRFLLMKFRALLSFGAIFFFGPFSKFGAFLLTLAPFL